MERLQHLRAAGILGITVALTLGACANGYAERKGDAQDTQPIEQATDSAFDQGAGQQKGQQTTATKAPAETSATPATTALVPADLSATTPVTADDIARAGGVDAFFWVEEISDAVFSRMEGASYGPDCTVPREDLRYVRVLYVDAEGTSHVGELVVNARVADEVCDIFRQLYDAKFPIRKMRLVDDYGGSDEDSCADGNTSAFNYRNIPGTGVISNHSYGLAIDINTFENPYYIPEENHIWPPEAAAYLDRTLDDPYMIHPGDTCYELFTSHGWQWGGDWATPLDYQHFEKPYA